MKSWFLEEINKIDMAFSQIKQKKKKRQKTHINKIQMKRKTLQQTLRKFKES